MKVKVTHTDIQLQISVVDIKMPTLKKKKLITKRPNDNFSLPQTYVYIP